MRESYRVIDEGLTRWAIIVYLKVGSSLKRLRTTVIKLSQYSQESGQGTEYLPNTGLVCSYYRYWISGIFI
jgi:hypothetical protein